MLKVLILGGTRYIGRELIRLLLEDDQIALTVMSTHKPAYLTNKQWVCGDRYSIDSLSRILANNYWDVVYDHLCFNQSQAELSCHFFKGKVGHYLFISSQAVYPAGLSQAENLFRPKEVLPLTNDVLQQYSFGKRAAEHCFYTNAEFPVTTVRFSPVLSSSCIRLSHNLTKMNASQKLIIQDFDKYISLIDLEDAANFLFFLKDKPLNMPINACCDHISLSWIAKEILKLFPSVQTCVYDKAFSTDPFNVHTAWEVNEELFYLSVADNWTMDNHFARKLGFSFKALASWFPQTIQKIWEDVCHVK